MWKERVTYVRAHPAPKVSRLRRAVVTATGVALAGAFIAYGGAASASPGPSADQVRQRISKLMSQLDAVAQQYDSSSSQLSAANARMTVINRQLSHAQRNFEATRTAITQIASAAYEQGDFTSMMAMLASNDPQTVLDRAELLDHLSSDRRAQMSAFISAAKTLSEQQQTQQRTQMAIQQLTKQKAAQKKRLQQLLAKNQTELKNLTAPAPSAVSPAGGGGSSSSSSGGGGGVPINTAGATGAAAKAVAFAESVVGCPYTWGGTGPCSSGYDCSGMVMSAWAAAGVQIPRTTYDQYASLPHVALSSIQPGDLMFYDGIGHVAMYVGHGNIVDAPSPGLNVEEIPASTSWYAQNFDGAARP